MNSSVLSTRSFKVRSSKGDEANSETVRLNVENWYVLEPTYETENSPSEDATAVTTLVQQVYLALSRFEGVLPVDPPELHQLPQTVASQGNTMVWESRVAPPKVHGPLPPPSEKFRMIRKYDGIISSRSETSFWAAMRESESDKDIIEVEFDIDDLPVSDRPLVQQGVPVVWTLGVEIANGTYKNQSIVYVRRIASPPATALENSEKLVTSRMAQIGWK